MIIRQVFSKSWLRPSHQVSTTTFYEDNEFVPTKVALQIMNIISNICLQHFDTDTLNHIDFWFTHFWGAGRECIYEESQIYSYQIFSSSDIMLKYLLLLIYNFGLFENGQYPIRSILSINLNANRCTVRLMPATRQPKSHSHKT